ncbi:MAG TPA: transposase [Nannocystis sp.]|jgi:hypothetical protein
MRRVQRTDVRLGWGLAWSRSGVYFEGIGSERGIVWRVADSLSLRRFLRLSLEQPTPDHSTLSRTPRRLPAKLHERQRGQDRDKIGIGSGQDPGTSRPRIGPSAGQYARHARQPHGPDPVDFSRCLGAHRTWPSDQVSVAADPCH